MEDTQVSQDATEAAAEEPRTIEKYGRVWKLYGDQYQSARWSQGRNDYREGCLTADCWAYDAGSVFVHVRLYVSHKHSECCVSKRTRAVNLDDALDKASAILDLVEARLPINEEAIVHILSLNDAKDRAVERSEASSLELNEARTQLNQATSTHSANETTVNALEHAITAMVFPEPTSAAMAAE